MSVRPSLLLCVMALEGCLIVGGSKDPDVVDDTDVIDDTDSHGESGDTDIQDSDDTDTDDTDTDDTDETETETETETDDTEPDTDDTDDTEPDTDDTDDSDSAPPPLAPGPRLLITEIADHPVDFNLRYVELCNRGDTPADLTGLELQRYANDQTTSQDVALPSILLAPGAAFVIVQATGAAAYQATWGRPPELTSGYISGNGNDTYVLALVAGGTLDIYGEIGVDGTGEPWEYTDSFRFRAGGVFSANPVWTAAEWTSSALPADANPGSCLGTSLPPIDPPDETGDSATPTDSAYLAAITWADDVRPLLTPCHGCHTQGGVSGGLSWGGANDLINVPSFDVPSMDEVEPGDHTRSYWWHKLNGSHLTVGGAGWQMPRTLPPLAPADIALIAQWIDDGAIP